MREGPSTPFRASRDVLEAIALLSLSRTRIYELIPSPLRLPHLVFAFRELARPQSLQQMSPGVLSCYPTALRSNRARGSWRPAAHFSASPTSSLVVAQ